MANSKKKDEWEEDAEEGPYGGLGATAAAPREQIVPVSDMQFHIYNSPHRPRVFLVVSSPEAMRRAPKPPKGDWHLFKIVPEIGRPRIGFSEADAKRDIAKQGYHMIEISIETRETEHALPPRRRAS